ncbi:hypothetical protein GIB67_009614 [Kingdonia uniflora]|uniref:Aminotransferase-like plant mobile domain-containing protein n=1 Tax=Kingdonia uniflora TaxID=39325 RepID=A0A7J7M290_9MAGN|nr:hypothetical protein GIB67_009614 [Kingdonia uniflora]
MDASGFAYFPSIKWNQGDNRLVIALIERWWDVTHTFHFPCGEIEFPPLDFYILTGIRVGFGCPPPFATVDEVEELAALYIPNIKDITISFGYIPGGFIDQLFDMKKVEKYDHETIVRIFLLYMLSMYFYGYIDNKIRLGHLMALKNLDKAGHHPGTYKIIPYARSIGLRDWYIDVAIPPRPRRQRLTIPAVDPSSLVDVGVLVPDDVTRAALSEMYTKQMCLNLGMRNVVYDYTLQKEIGRKRACATSCITYILSCITKHSPQYKILMVGGIAISLLFSAFVSWLVAERNKVKYIALPLNECLALPLNKCFPVMMPLIFNLFLQMGFEQQWLSVTFSKAIFFSNGLVAIIAGLFGNMLADTLGFGPVAPFDATTCFLAIGMTIIMSSWSKNFGDPSENKDLFTQFKGAAVAIASGECLTTF